MPEKTPVNLNDPLWDRFRNGSLDAFEEIYKAHARTLLHYGRKINSNREIVHDEVHDLFSRLWENRSSIGPTQSVKNYLLKSLRNSLYKVSQSNNKLNLEYMLFDQEEDFFESRENEIIELEETHTKRKLVKRALVELSKREQEILHLRFFENMSLEEIAKVIDVKYQSVKNTSFVAISKLRDFFSDHLD